ncbi:hypothetical protein RYH73_08625 [Olivibacter sp. CPCC 100613]|uniref:hypothetical protein n=1 Tax=Olivibacter sp. CPCC 100613 TaxID=3079931 RepID=UPI002FF55532
MESYYRYYRIFTDTTEITTMSSNDFVRINMKPFKTIWKDNHPVKVYYSLTNQVYSLIGVRLIQQDFVDKVTAMENAKIGALRFISSLIEQADAIIATLKQYRIDHYDDLNKNLLDNNIRRLEKLMRNN